MKTKRAFLNFITDFIPLIVISVLGIFKLKIFLNVFGDETLGLYQLFSNIMVYIALVDGGLSSALLVALYKPNQDNDKKKMNELLSAGNKTFSMIGAIVFMIAGIVSFFVHFLIKNSSFTNLYIAIAFIIFSLSNVINYFFVPYQTLLEVKERKYLYNIPYQLGQIVLSILEIVMILTGFSFISVLLMHVIVKLVTNILMLIICKKAYPEYNYRNKDKDFSFNKSIGDLLIHKINGLISYNIDILIISKFLGLASVAIYSTYNYIITMLKNILGKIESSIKAIIGNRVAKSKEGSYEIFTEINSLMFFIATVLCIPLMFALNSFIDIWYEGEIMTTKLICYAFCIYLFVFIIKMSITTFTTAAGLFKETKFCAWTDTIVNLILSFALVYLLGISGVVYATAVSAFIAEFILKGIVIYKHIFNKNYINFFIGNIKFALIAVLDFVMGYLLFNVITISNIFSWFLIFMIYTIINGALVLGIYGMMHEIKFIGRVKQLLKRG